MEKMEDFKRKHTHKQNCFVLGLKTIENENTAKYKL